MNETREFSFRRRGCEADLQGSSVVGCGVSENCAGRVGCGVQAFDPTSHMDFQQQGKRKKQSITIRRNGENVPSYEDEVSLLLAGGNDLEKIHSKYWAQKLRSTSHDSSDSSLL